MQYNSMLFIKGNGKLFPLSEIAIIDYCKIEDLILEITLKNNEKIIINDIEALEAVMQIRPSVIEGKRFVWYKFSWLIHNLFGHPLMQIFALFKMYKLAFYIHDVTVPKIKSKKVK